MKRTIMKIPKDLLLDVPIYQDQRGSLDLLYCHTVPILNARAKCSGPPSQILLSKTNPFTGRGLHFQSKCPLFQIISVIDGEITECLVERDMYNQVGSVFSQRINSTDRYNTFMVPAGWAHGFYTLSSSATLIYMVWGKRNVSDESGFNLKSPSFKFMVPSVAERIYLNERDNNYEFK